MNAEQLREQLWHDLCLRITVKALEREYSTGKHPESAWTMMALSDHHNMPYPAWVMNYLKETAIRITSYVPETKKHNDKDKRLAKVLTEALGGLGKNNLNSMFDRSKKILFYNEIERLQKEGCKEKGLKAGGRNIGEALKAFQAQYENEPHVGGFDSNKKKYGEIKREQKGLGNAIEDVIDSFYADHLKPVTGQEMIATGVPECIAKNAARFEAQLAIRLLKPHEMLIVCEALEEIIARFAKKEEDYPEKKKVELTDHKEEPNTMPDVTRQAGERFEADMQKVMDEMVRGIKDPKKKP